MANKRGLATTGSVAFQASQLGPWAARQFAERIASVGLRPRHVALLEMLRGGARSQLDLAKALGVTASVVVDMLDELERLGAVARARSAVDRRRQGVELTARGRSLADSCVAISYQIDEVMLAHLRPAERRQFQAAMRAIAQGLGLPCSES